MTAPHYELPEDRAGTVFDPSDPTFGPIMAAIQRGDFERAAAVLGALATRCPSCGGPLAGWSGERHSQQCDWAGVAPCVEAETSWPCQEDCSEKPAVTVVLVDAAGDEVSSGDFVYVESLTLTQLRDPEQRARLGDQLLATAEAVISAERLLAKSIAKSIETR